MRSTCSKLGKIADFKTLRPTRYVVFLFGGITPQRRGQETWQFVKVASEVTRSAAAETSGPAVLFRRIDAF